MGALFELVGSRPELDLGVLAATLREEGVVKLAGLFGSGLATLTEETDRLRRFWSRREVVLGDDEPSPRRMSTVGGDVIKSESELLRRLYFDRDLLDLLSRIAGEEVLPVPDPIEDIVLNALHQEGDTHGAHLDVYSFAFTICVRAPMPGRGGVLEYARGQGLSSALPCDSRQVLLEPGDSYFMSTDSGIHRVTQVASGAVRVVLTLAYANEATLGARSYSTQSLYAR